MQIKVTKKMGNSVVEFKTDKPMEDAMLELDAFMKKDVCNCGSTDIIFDTRKVNAKDGSGTFVYVKRRCMKCNQTSTLGKLKDGSGYFWKEWELYQPAPQPAQQEPSIPPYTPPVKEEIKTEDIPFG
jgi:hypothetical protein